MSTLKTNNLQHLDSGSANIELAKGGGAIHSGISTFQEDIHLNDIVHLQDTDTKIRFPSDNTVTVETGGSERARITSHGDVGIGTNTVGNIAGRSQVVIGGDSGGLLDFNVGGTTEARLFATDATGLTIRASESDGGIIFQTGGSNQRFSITSDGKVGIGTHNPQYVLDISNGAASGIRIGVGTHAYRIRTNASTSNDYGFFIEDEEGTDLYNVRGPHATSVPNVHRFYTQGTERVRITPAGNVGINESSPGGLLQVGASSGSHVIITPNTGIDVNDGAINLYQATTNVNAVPFVISSDVGGTEIEKLRFTAGGKLGIGTADPTEELHVIGKIIKTEYNPGELIECIETIANGINVTVGSGTYSPTNVSATQDLSSSYADINGSVFTYNVPVGTKRLVYDFWVYMRDKDVGPLLHFKGLTTPDGSSTYTTVNDSRATWRAATANADYQMWIHNRMVLFENSIDEEDIGAGKLYLLGGTTRKLKFQCREYSASYEGQLHTSNNWDGSGTDILVRPHIRISAYA